MLSNLTINPPVMQKGGETISFSSTGQAEAFSGGGVTLSRQITSRGEVSELMLTFESDKALHNVQMTQTLELALDWKSYVIAPGVMYDGNRFLVSPQPYCPYLPTEGVTPDGPIMQADVPRLCSDTGYRTELAANALAIPAVGVYDPKLELGYLIGVEIYGAWGVAGVNLVTLPGEPVRVEVCLPVMRKKRYHFCDWIEPDNEPGMTIEPGKPVSCKIRVITVHASGIPDFIRRLAEYGYAQRGQEARRPVLSFAEAAELIESKLDDYNWREDLGYYKAGMGDAPNSMLQTGWVGGGVTMIAMAMSENPERRRRARRMLDFICRGGLSPSGYFHGLHDGSQWRSFGVKRPGCRSSSLIRRSLECARDVLKMLELLKNRGEPIEAAWEHAAKSNLDAMVDTATRFGHLGYTVDRDNGDVLWGDSTCGAFGIEPLVRGAAWFHEPAYLETASKLAEYYVTHFLEKGFTCGGVGDALMAVDSESNYALLAGLVHLHAATGEPRHLAWARQAADLFATWVLCYDAQLPPDSPLGKLGIQPRGAVLANSQNQHGAPGICTASGDALLKLYEATGEEHYLRMLEDIAQCIPQMIVRAGQEEVWGKSPPGCVTERLMTMDGMEPNGHTSHGSTWSEIAALLTARELPPVYHDAKRGIEAVFDVSNLRAPACHGTGGPGGPKIACRRQPARAKGAGAPEAMR